MVLIDEPEAREQYLIETSELEELLKDGPMGPYGDLKLVDCTWYMPGGKLDAKEEYDKKRITQETVFFDHDLICDPKSELPHSLPPLEVFIRNMQSLKI